jgi:hypothetical protein
MAAANFHALLANRGGQARLVAFDLVLTFT